MYPQLAYYYQHREYKLKYQKEYYRKNKEMISAYYKQYYINKKNIKCKLPNKRVFKHCPQIQKNRAKPLFSNLSLIVSFD